MKMSHKSWLAAAVMLVASSGAYANCNGRGCDDGGTSPGNNTAYGGAGGAGGSGVGVGVGVGVGIGQGGNASATGGEGGRGGAGGSVLGSGNSSNTNANSNKQAQGQQQGQAQSSKNNNRNDNRSNSSASNSNSNANSGNNSDQSVTVQGDNYEARRIPVATAYAPNIAPTAVCMGTSSAGAQGVTFGISVGTSWTDDNCMKLEQARTLAAVLNDPATAAELLCDIPAIAAARTRVGKPCGVQQVAQAAPAPVAAQAPAVRAQTAAVAPTVSPVPPKFDTQRYRITLNGLQPTN